MIDPRKIWSSAQLPTLPTVALQLLELSGNQEADIRRVIEVIKADPAITAKILKSANSSFFAFKSKVTSLERAVPLLGTTVVTSLALSFSLVEAAMTTGPMAEHYRDYWRQSVVQGLTAELLAGRRGNGPDCEAFLAGLLTDLGRLAMLKTISKEYLPVLEATRDDLRPLHEVEREQLGFDHVEIGMKLMEQWNLPEPLIAAVRLQHVPAEQVYAEHVDHAETTRLVAFASAVGEYYCSPAKGPALQHLQELSGRYFGDSEQSLRDLLDRVRARMDETAELFSTNAEDLGDPADLMAMANEHLAQLALREHIASTQAMARQEELESQNRELQKQALHDPLTEIYNRHYLDEALRNEIERCGRSATAIGVIFADVDRFKPLNDTWGHQFGDLVLQRVARAFADVLRKADVLARYGGEEFVVLVHQPTEKGLERVAERIRARIEAEVIENNGQRIPVTISVGAAMAVPRRNDTELAQRLVAAADEAMYESKQNGRNQVRLRVLMDEQERALAQRTTQTRFSRWLVRQGALDVQSLSKGLLECHTPHVKIGVLAQQKEYLDAAQIDQVLQAQHDTHDRFGHIALQLGLLDEDRLAQLLAWQQEDPLQLANTLIRLGLLDKARTAELLREYLTECRTGRLDTTPAPTV